MGQKHSSMNYMISFSKVMINKRIISFGGGSVGRISIPARFLSLNLQAPFSSKPSKPIVKVNIGDSAHTEKVFTMDDVKLYANLSTDVNPIHIDPTYAANTRFKAPIVHGLLTASLLSAVVGNQLPGKGSVYISQVLNFKRPVYVGDKVIAKVEVSKIQKDKKIITLNTTCIGVSSTSQSSKNINNTENEEKVVVDGEAVIYFPELDTS